MSRIIDANNIDRIVLDLKDDLKIERLSAEDDILDQLLALAVDGLQSEDVTERHREEVYDLKESIQDMKRAFERIESIAEDYS